MPDCTGEREVEDVDAADDMDGDAMVDGAGA
jgi:hypothetical protein